MAFVQFNTSFNMFSLETFYGSVTDASADRVVVTNGSSQSIYLGDFTYSGDNVFGDVQAVDLTLGGQSVFLANSFNYPAESLQYYVETNQIVQAFSEVLSTDDRMIGSADDDVIGAFAGNDIIEAGAGNDILYGNEGSDQLFGNQGFDTIFAGQSSDVAYGGQNDDQVLGNQGNDQLFGNFGNDFLHGGQDSDFLHGGQENDMLDGGAGSDILNGGIGNDALTGGAGSDLFVFSPGNGNDLVTDFNFAAGDRLDLGTRNYVTAAGSDVSTQISFMDGSTIILQGVPADAFNASFIA